MKDTTGKSNREKEILRWLDGWRELALIVKAVLLWQLPSYPFAILGTVTLLFLQISNLEPLTLVCGVSLLVVLLDYVVPRISQRIWQTDEWTSSKQAELEHMSHAIASSVDFVAIVWSRLLQAKQTSPTTYYAVVVPTLLIFGWLGSLVNNLFITYLLVLLIAMFPGLHHRGLIAKYYVMVLDTVLQVLRGFTQRSQSRSISDKKVN